MVGIIGYKYVEYIKSENYNKFHEENWYFAPLQKERGIGGGRIRPWKNYVMAISSSENLKSKWSLCFTHKMKEKEQYQIGTSAARFELYLSYLVLLNCALTSSCFVNGGRRGNDQTLQEDGQQCP